MSCWTDLLYTVTDKPSKEVISTSFLISKLFFALWLGILWVLCHRQTLYSLPGFHTCFSALWWLLPQSILAMIDDAKWWCSYHILLPCIACLRQWQTWKLQEFLFPPLVSFWDIFWLFNLLSTWNNLIIRVNRNKPKIIIEYLLVDKLNMDIFLPELI